MNKMATKEQKEDKAILEKRLAKVASITAVAASEGGRILVTELIRDVLAIMDTICAKHQQLTLAEFVALGAEMKSKIDLAQVIAHSKNSELQVRQELAELIVAIGEEEQQ